MKFKLLVGMFSLGLGTLASVFITLFAQRALRQVVDLRVATDAIDLESGNLRSEVDNFESERGEEVNYSEDGVLLQGEVVVEDLGLPTDEWSAMEKMIMKRTAASVALFFILATPLILISVK